MINFLFGKDMRDLIKAMGSFVLIVAVIAAVTSVVVYSAALVVGYLVR